MSIAKARRGALCDSFFDNVCCFDFGLNFGLVLDPVWGCLGILLAPFWELKSGQVKEQMRLECLFVRKC